MWLCFVEVEGWRRFWGDACVHGGMKGAIFEEGECGRLVIY